jgi:hypothetical protein
MGCCQSDNTGSTPNDRQQLLDSRPVSRGGIKFSSGSHLPGSIPTLVQPPLIARGGAYPPPDPFVASTSEGSPPPPGFAATTPLSLPDVGPHSTIMMQYCVSASANQGHHHHPPPPPSYRPSVGRKSAKKSYYVVLQRRDNSPPPAPHSSGDNVTSSRISLTDRLRDRLALGGKIRSVPSMASSTSSSISSSRSSASMGSSTSSISTSVGSSTSGESDGSPVLLQTQVVVTVQKVQSTSPYTYTSDVERRAFECLLKGMSSRNHPNLYDLQSTQFISSSSGGPAGGPDGQQYLIVTRPLCESGSLRDLIHQVESPLTTPYSEKYNEKSSSKASSERGGGLSGLPLPQIALYGREVLEAMRYCEAAFKIQCNHLTSSNILMVATPAAGEEGDEGEGVGFTAKLTDFENALLLNQSSSLGGLTLPLEASGAGRDQPVLLFGHVLYEMFFGRKMRSSGLRDSDSLGGDNGGSPELREVFEAIFNSKDGATNRLTIGDLIALPFFASVDYESIHSSNNRDSNHQSSDLSNPNEPLLPQQKAVATPKLTASAKKMTKICMSSQSALRQSAILMYDEELVRRKGVRKGEKIKKVANKNKKETSLRVLNVLASCSVPPGFEALPLPPPMIRSTSLRMTEASFVSRIGSDQYYDARTNSREIESI